MKRKIIIETDHALKDGELLQYKDGIIKSVGIRELLPDLAEAKKAIADLSSTVESHSALIDRLSSQVGELRGED